MQRFGRGRRARRQENRAGDRSVRATRHSDSWHPRAVVRVATAGVALIAVTTGTVASPSAATPRPGSTPGAIRWYDQWRVQRRKHRRGLVDGDLHDDLDRDDLDHDELDVDELDARVRGSGHGFDRHDAAQPLAGPSHHVTTAPAALGSSGIKPFATASSQLGALPATAGTQRAGRAQLATSQPNPPGRVSQITGYAGNNFGPVNTANLSETITLPSVTQGSVTNPPSPWPPVMGGSQGAVGLYNGPWGVQIFLDYNNVGGSTWKGMRVISSMDATCRTSSGCQAYQPGFFPGDSVQLTLDSTTTSTTGTITDLSDGNSMSWTGPGINDSSAQIQMGVEDYCYLSSETVGDTPCSQVAPGSALGPPPGFSSFGSVTFTDVTVNGTSLGSLFGGGTLGFWDQLISTWGAMSDLQSTYVGSGSTFTINESSIPLPTASLAVGTPSQVDRPSSGTTTIPFTVTLSASSGQQVYVDYTTVDGTAVAGNDYQGSSGYLYFAPGTTSETVPVTINGGPEQGGDHTFQFKISNPAYTLLGTTTASGLIHEGPVVYSVSPSPVPLTGDGTAMTITGADFGTSGDSVQFCLAAGYGGTGCVDAPGATIDSDTQISVVAPDATAILPAQQSEFNADTIVTDAHSVASPIKPYQDQVQFGCGSTTVTDALYDVKGCITQETYSNDDNTEQQSSVDGLALSASTSDQVNYATSGADAITSTGSSTVSLNLQNKLIKIFQGKINQLASTPMTFAIPANTQIAGMKLSGNLTITPGTPGQATGTVTVTLPGVIGAAGGSSGGATGTLTFTTTTAGGASLGGLSNLAISVPQANFMHLFSLSNVNLTYKATTSSGVWKVTGTATTGGNQTTKFSGSLTAAPTGKVTAASLNVGSISLAGLVHIKNLDVKLKAGAWSGSANITQKTQTGTEKATVALAFDGSGNLLSGSLDATNVPVFGVLEVSSFQMSYSSGNWSLAVAASASGSGGSAGLTVTNGVITQANLSVTNLSFLGKFTVANASISYSASQPNPACNTVNGSEIWCGSWQVDLPQATTISGVSGSLAFQNGQFASGSIDVTGNVPLLDGVFLTSLGGSLTLNPPPTTISGHATVTFGPTVDGTTLLSLSSTLTRKFPSGATSGTYDASGSLERAEPSTRHCRHHGAGRHRGDDLRPLARSRRRDRAHLLRARRLGAGDREPQGIVPVRHVLPQRLGQRGGQRWIADRRLDEGRQQRDGGVRLDLARRGRLRVRLGHRCGLHLRLEGLQRAWLLTPEGPSARQGARSVRKPARAGGGRRRRRPAFARATSHRARSGRRPGTRRPPVP